VSFADTPTFIKRLSSDSLDGGKLRRIKSLLQKDSATFSQLPAIPGVPEAHAQPLSCQLQGQAGTDGQEDLGRAPRSKHVRFREEGTEADKAHRVAAVLKLPKVNESQEAKHSSRAQSSLSQASHGTPSRLPLLVCDSVRLLRRRRAEKKRQKEAEETAASTSQAEAGQPEESSADRAGALPPIQEETRAPQHRPPHTKAPACRKGTRHPR
ncbi:hypothetical protein CIB84_016540, partial [Bambusicola thoracicus]